MNLFWVTSSMALASRPRGNDWLFDEMADLRRQKVDVLVSCLTTSEERELELSEEERAATASGMSFVRLPIEDRGVPTSRVAFDTVIDDLAQAQRTGRRVAIHCRQGLGRSPLVAAGLLVHAGLTPEAAWAVIGDRRGVPVPETDAQRNWVRLGDRRARATQLS